MRFALQVRSLARRRPIPTVSRTPYRCATRTAGSTIRARGSAATIATVRASWRSCATTAFRRTTKYSSRGRRYTPARSSIAGRSQDHAPVGLPDTYDVVTDDGVVLTPDQHGLESNIEAASRAKSQEYVWNEIWKRRLVYFATVGVTRGCCSICWRVRCRRRTNTSARSAGCSTSSAWSAASCRVSRRPGSMPMARSPGSDFVLCRDRADMAHAARGRHHGCDERDLANGCRAHRQDLDQLDHRLRKRGLYLVSPPVETPLGADRSLRRCSCTSASPLAVISRIMCRTSPASPAMKARKAQGVARGEEATFDFATSHLAPAPASRWMGPARGLSRRGGDHRAVV